MASRHTRKESGRRFPLRVTRGPLDDDPLSSTESSITSPIRASITKPLGPSETIGDVEDSVTKVDLESATVSQSPEPEARPEKDLSFLLHSEIYHPLSQLEVAPPFRRPLPGSPNPETPLYVLTEQLEELMMKCDFLPAAHLAGSILGSGSKIISPTNTQSIFELVSIRFSCLELTGNTLLASNESKALLDLFSPFYYHESPLMEDSELKSSGVPAPLEHIMPFGLRLQALRLQSIGFSDAWRGITSLYEVADEVHANIRSTSGARRSLWVSRLAEVGLRVVNSLVEMGDLDSARRALDSATLGQESLLTDLGLEQRRAFLYIKLGDIQMGHKALDRSPALRESFSALLAMADGRYEEAVEILESQKNDVCKPEDRVAFGQNLAVAQLYCGRIDKALQQLINTRSPSRSLTINLATLLELSTEKSKDLKLSLALSIAKNDEKEGHAISRNAADFKL